MDYHQKIITDIELLSVEGIQDCFVHGVSPNDLFRSKPLIYELIGGYARGPRFSECIKVFIQYGLHIEDKALVAVLANDATTLDAELDANPALIHTLYTMDCAFTPLYEVTLLHICAEFGHAACAEVLVKHGAGINTRAGLDENGFGGQTPIFHTVNQHNNFSIALLQYLLTQAPDLEYTVKGLLWGKGYEWETFIPAVNPASYAMMGLLPQFQRTEVLIYEIISLLIKNRYGINYVPGNIPNKYLYK